MIRQLVITGDGSSSVFIAELGEHYHSVHGALQESQHVFINAGLYQKIQKQEDVAILEIGFGTGLNALLTCMEAETHQQNISYTSVEKYPLNAEIYTRLNYCALLGTDDCHVFFNDIHSCPSETRNQISGHFCLLKHIVNVENISFNEQFDIIYFDAFAPSVQPELWTAAIFSSMFRALKPDGILVTYCAKGEVKRTMRSVGFSIESLPGPKGKREMTRAIK